MMLLDPLFRTEAMREIFSDRACLQGILDFEAALARAQATKGIIPASAARRIAAKCRAELFDFHALARDARKAGNLAIPLVKQLTALVARDSPAAARHVHWGATSQDAIDTGAVLQTSRALSLIDVDVQRLGAALAKQARAHERTVMAGRTWGQQALPITLGLKLAGWLDALTRHRRRIADMNAQIAVLQFGGAAGTLASLGSRGLDVGRALARELDLALPAAPWHATRDRIAETGTALALLTGSLGKMARDIASLMQTEVGEVLEPAAPGKGGSSTMPHKRNPVGSAVVLAAAARMPGLAATLLAAMGQEHERGLGGWHAEWETLPDMFNLTAGALLHMVEMIEGLEARPARMRANLDATQGLLMAEAVAMELGRHVGKAAAHASLEAACKRAMAEGWHLRDVVLADESVREFLPAREVRALFDPANYLGMSREFIGRVLAEWRSSGSARRPARTAGAGGRAGRKKP